MGQRMQMDQRTTQKAAEASLPWAGRRRWASHGFRAHTRGGCGPAENLKLKVKARTEEAPGLPTRSLIRARARARVMQMAEEAPRPGRRTRSLLRARA